jgi:signal transduction histidine kinase/DNA-binding NarL/FixJ family response regulator
MRARFNLLKLFASACLLATLVRPALALTPIEAGPDLKRQTLFTGLAYLEDPRKELTFDTVRALPDERYTALTRDNFQRGISASAYWVRARFVNTGDKPVEWIFDHLMPFTDFVEFQVVVDGKVVTTAIGGDRTKVAVRQVQYRYPAVRHTSRPGETADVYVRAYNVHGSYVNLLFAISPVDEYLGNVATDQLRLGILYGMPLALAFMALIGWIMSRDRRFYLYALYALAVLGSWMGMNGLLSQYLFFWSPDLANEVLQVFFLLAILFSSMFSRDFLQTRELLPWADRYFRFMIWVSVGAIVLRAFGVHTPVTQVAVVLVFMDAVSPLVGWLALRRGVSHARWYIMAQLLYSSMVVISVKLAELTSYSYGGFVFAEISFVGQLMLLSIAQYDRMRTLRRDKEEYEKRYQSALETEIRERTHDLQKAREKADHANRSKSEFLANMSHEIRTPINAIAGFTTLALRNEHDPKQRGYLDKIYQGTQGLLRIINDLLDFSKIEAGRLDMEKISFPLNEVMETMTAYVGPSAAAKGLTLSVHVAPEVPKQLVGDPLRLGQILINLCSNAVKFTERGEVEVRVVTKQGAAEGVRLLFAVRDTGIGLSSEQSDKLFQPFTQADTSTTRKFGGTGLGLAISRRLVDMMNGKIWLQSQEAVGTTFFFEVDLEIGEANAAAPVQPSAAVTSADAAVRAGRLAGVRLLLVEDNPINQQLAQELLEQEGAQVQVAGNGRVALEAIQSRGMDYFDAALVDLQMPEVDGYETATRLRKLPGGERLPLIAMTGHAMAEERARCLAVGMQDHLAKPIDPELMVEKLVKWIGTEKLDGASKRAEAIVASKNEAAQVVTQDSLGTLLANFSVAMKAVNDRLAILVQEPKK